MKKKNSTTQKKGKKIKDSKWDKTPNVTTQNRTKLKNFNVTTPNKNVTKLKM